MDLLRRDLTNARTLGRSADGRAAVLDGHGGLARSSLGPTGRLTRVTYRVRPPGSPGGAGSRGGPPCLVREQQYLDDPARPEAWAEVVAVGVRRFALSATMGSGQDVDGSPGDAPPDEEPGDGVTGGVQREDGPATTNGGAAPVPSSVWVRVETDAGAVDELLRVR